MNEQEVEDFLSHYGVKGMKWGIRKDRDGVPRKTDRAAAKDAKEFARAKMYYGEGAGNRRKLIKATVEARKKRDPAYAKSFERHLNEQDLSKHASKATSQRKRTDRVDSAKKSGGYLARLTTGEMGNKAAVTAIVVTGATYLNSPQGRRTMSTTVKKAKRQAESFVSKVSDNPRSRKKMVSDLEDFLRRNS